MCGTDSQVAAAIDGSIARRNGDENERGGGGEDDEEEEEDDDDRSQLPPSQLCLLPRDSARVRGNDPGHGVVHCRCEFDAADSAGTRRCSRGRHLILLLALLSLSSF